MSTSIICTAIERHPTTPDAVLALAQSRLDAREIGLLSNRSSSKRRAEFVIGRVAARQAVSQLLCHSYSRALFVILREGNGPTGRPTVVVDDREVAPYVSISHADGIAIAAASYRRIGIDIATIEAQSQSFVQEAFSADELQCWADWVGATLSSPLAVTTAFAAKEAALKWLGTGMALPLRALTIIPRVWGLDGHTPGASDRARAFQVDLSVAGNAHSELLEAQFFHWGDRVAVLVAERQAPEESTPSIPPFSPAAGASS